MSRFLKLTPNHPIAVHTSIVDKAGCLKNPELSLFVPADSLKRTDCLIGTFIAKPPCGWNLGLTKESDIRVKKISDSQIAKKRNSSWNNEREKLKYRMKENNPAHTHPESHFNLGERSKEYGAWNKDLIKENNISLAQSAIKISRTMKEKGVGKGILKNYSSNLIHYQKILEVGIDLEKQGYRFVPIHRVIPDAIAIKEGKIYAIEVETHKNGVMRKKEKYNKDNIINLFDGVIWIVYGGNKNETKMEK